MRSARTYLYVPGDQPDKLGKALGRGADALIVDLEDAVAPARKEAARAQVGQWLRGLADGQGRSPEIWVRTNPGAAAAADIAEVACASLTGVVIAKTESRAEVDAADTALTAAEREAGITPGTIAVMPLLESAAALLAAADIARGPRVAALQLGEVDLAADLGAAPGPGETELLWARSQAVAASAAAGLFAPVGAVRADFRDLEGLRTSTEALRRMGFFGRACIHPAQLPVVREAFTPTAEEVDRARALVGEFTEASAEGTGIYADSNGRLVDAAVVRAAHRTLAAAGHNPGSTRER
ncbi:MAG: CoA ester lyase [Nocardiopsaceae bacterium]|nr:CoA ester lyase [Nocardiopsaceae bacterium]